MCCPTDLCSSARVVARVISRVVSRVISRVLKRVTSRVVSRVISRVLARGTTYELLYKCPIRFEILDRKDNFPL